MTLLLLKPSQVVAIFSIPLIPLGLEVEQVPFSSLLLLVYSLLPIKNIIRPLALATWVLLTVVIYCIISSIPLCSFKNLVPVLFSLSTSHSSLYFLISMHIDSFSVVDSLSVHCLNFDHFFGIFFLSYNFDHNSELAIINNSDSSDFKHPTL